MPFIQFDNPLIAAIAGAIINGKGDIAATHQWPKTNRTRWIMCQSRRLKTGWIILHRGIAAKMASLGNIGKKGANQTIAFGLKREHTIKFQGTG